jgi:FkbM family methyltransferase
MTISINGFELAVPDHLVDVYTAAHEPLTSAWMTNRLRRGMTALDIGAHVGVFSVQMSACVGPSGHVYAIEPGPNELACLRSNLSSHSIENVTVIEGAAGAKSSSRKFCLSTISLMQGFYEHPYAATREVVTVREFRADEVAPKPNLVKVDVEGAELEVLDGMSQWFQEAPLPFLIIEWNPECLTSAGFDYRKLPEALSGLGYSLQVADEEAGTWLQVNEALDIVAGSHRPYSWYGNLLCEPQV